MRFFTFRFPGNLVWNPVVYLQMPPLIGSQANTALATTFLQESVLQALGQGLASAEPAVSHLGGVRKPVRANLPSFLALDAESFQRNTSLSNIPRGARWMVVSVLGFQVFRGDKAVLEDVSYDNLRALPLDAF